MADPLSEPGVKVEAQPPAAHSTYLDCDSTGAAPTNQHLDEFDNLIDPSVFESHGNDNAPLQNNARPIEATTSPGVCLAGALSSPTAPWQYSCNPFPSNEAVPIESSEWPTGCIPWWPQTGSERSSNSITDAGSWDANMSDLQGYNTREISLASPTTDPGQCEYGPGWLPASSDWARRKSITSEQSEKGFNGKGSGPLTVQKSTINLSGDPISTDSGLRAIACISPQPPGNSRRASSSRHAQSQKTQRQTRSSPPPPQPKQRARNRRAANKSRAKTKAANSELVATEKAESLKHQALSETVSGLQEEVFALKSKLLQHGNCNDPIIEQYLEQRARSLAFGSRATTDLESGTLPSVANTRPV